MRAYSLILKTVAVLVVLLSILGIFVSIQWRQMVPDVPLAVTIADLDNDVGVRTDTLGVVHITADSEKDLLMAWGYQTAAEHLWEIEHLRMAAAGRLSELYGAETREFDLLLRHFQLTEIAAKQFRQLPEESRQYIDWYIAGINSWLEKNGDDLPVGFKVSARRPAAWQSIEVLGIQLFVAWCADESWEMDYVAYETARQLPDSLSAAFLAARKASAIREPLADARSMQRLWS